MMYMSKSAVSNRDEIIFGNYSLELYGIGGVRRFSGLSLDKVKKLISLQYLEKKECQNYSPSAGEMVEFAENHPETEWVFGGYAVSPERDDVRVTLDEFGSPGSDSVDDIVDFLKNFRFADELDGGLNEELRCWYD